MDAQGLTGRALGEAVLDRVLSFPEQHEQDLDHCGSSGCIVGWTLWLALGLPILNASWWVGGAGRWCREAYHAAWHGLDGPHELAAKLLGVDPDELLDTVYTEADEHKAISNFKHLLDTSGL